MNVSGCCGRFRGPWIGGAGGATVVLLALALSLVTALPAAAQSDTTPPEFVSATSMGNILTITFNEALDESKRSGQEPIFRVENRSHN